MSAPAAATAISTTGRSRFSSRAQTTSPSTTSISGIRWLMSTMIARPPSSSAPAPSAGPRRRRSNSAAAGGINTGSMIRASGGPARALPNGPVSSPAGPRGQPNGFLPIASWNRQFATIQAAQAVMTPNIHRRAASLRSAKCSKAATNTKKRTCRSDCSTLPPRTTLHPSTQAHQSSATTSQGVRSHRQSRARALTARKHTSTTAIMASAMPCPCIRNRGTSKAAPVAMRSTFAHARPGTGPESGLAMRPKAPRGSW